MNIDYIKLQDLTAGNNSNLIHFLDTVLNHSVDKKVWSWEFESIPKTIFTVAMAGEEIAGTQSMLPVFLNINDSIYETAKSETSFLNPVFRGKKIFEKLYQLAVDETVMNGTKLIWGFTPALKAWKNNLGFETFDDEIRVASVYVKYFPLRSNYKKSRNLIFAFGKYIVTNRKIAKNYFRLKALSKDFPKLEVSSRLKNENDLEELYNRIDVGKVHLDLNASYLNWRINNNPVIQYRSLFFYNEDQMVGYVIYSIREGNLHITDLTCDEIYIAEAHIIQYLLTNIEHFFKMSYWGNISHKRNKKIFSLFEKLGATVQIDTSRNFVYKNISTNAEVVSSLGNWYINGLWTEGFHI